MGIRWKRQKNKTKLLMVMKSRILLGSCMNPLTWLSGAVTLQRKTCQTQC